MVDELNSIFSRPFLLIQVGDYGEGYDLPPLPQRLAVLASPVPIDANFVRIGLQDSGPVH